MDEFEKLLEAERGAVERFVKFRLDSGTDADDVLQEVFLTAYQRFSQLKNRASFRAWIISIARNKCNDFYRKKAARPEISVGELPEKELSDSRYGVSLADQVNETLSLLGDRDREILSLYYWKDMPQAEIAARLNIPVGTVKSRLYTAKQNFKSRYPHRADTARRSDAEKGVCIMKKLPEQLPEYQIEASPEEPFGVKWEELMGWFLVPRLGEKLSWGMYDIPSRKRSHVYDMQVTGRARVHGIEGVELTAREAGYSDREDVIERTFVARLTDTHCRYLAAMRNDGDVRSYVTFLDGEEFLAIWGYGADNCGNEINLSPGGTIRRTGTVVTGGNRDFLLDIVGRYNVTLGGKSFDTVCVMAIASRHCDVVSEQFLDRNGRTVLWRRYNRDDWALERYGKRWSEQLPENDRLVVNGTTYVHWYDCITDYIL